MGSPLLQLDAGEVGYQALGWAGALAVVIAGWTTSNPTLYRVGLALQAVTPNWSRAKITLVAGVVTTVIACFPFVFTGLLDYVAVYGLLISPVGAIVVTEHWIFPRTGLRRYWSSQAGHAINWAALLAWAISVALAVLLERSGTLHLFYLFLPVYGCGMVSYWLLAKAMGAGEKGTAESEEASDQPLPSSEAPSPLHQPADPRMIIAGLVAVLALAACVWLGYCTMTAPQESYRLMLGKLHAQLPIPTLVYFVAGTIFFTLRERSKRGRAGSGAK
jgi:NCS1 family nucleobase:cation symporter-1